MEALATETIRSTETRLFHGGGCPTEWLYDRVDDMAYVAQPPKAFHMVGSAVHAMIEEFLQGNDPFEVWDAWLYAHSEDEREWLDTTKVTKETFPSLVEDTFDTWLKQYRKFYDGLEPFLTEYRLEFETPNGTPVVTTIDAVFRDEASNVYIVDWKTGTSKSGQDMQLHVYEYGMKRMGYPYIEDAWFHYTHLKDPIDYTKSGYPGDEFMARYIDEADRRRKEGPYLPNPSWFSCAYCQHKEACPLYADDAEAAAKAIEEVEVYFA